MGWKEKDKEKVRDREEKVNRGEKENARGLIREGRSCREKEKGKRRVVAQSGKRKVKGEG